MSTNFPRRNRRTTAVIFIVAAMGFVSAAPAATVNIDIKGVLQSQPSSSDWFNTFEVGTNVMNGAAFDWTAQYDSVSGAVTSDTLAIGPAGSPFATFDLRPAIAGGRLNYLEVITNNYPTAPEPDVTDTFYGYHWTVFGSDFSFVGPGPQGPVVMIPTDLTGYVPRSAYLVLRTPNQANDGFNLDVSSASANGTVFYTLPTPLPSSEWLFLCGLGLVVAPFVRLGSARLTVRPTGARVQLA